VGTTVWILVVWLGFGGRGLASSDAFRGGPTSMPVNYETASACKEAATELLKENAGMKAFRISGVECMAVRLPSKGKT